VNVSVNLMLKAKKIFKYFFDPNSKWNSNLKIIAMSSMIIYVVVIGTGCLLTNVKHGVNKSIPDLIWWPLLIKILITKVFAR
jgi:hypothetical protein